MKLSFIFLFMFSNSTGVLETEFLTVWEYKWEYDWEQCERSRNRTGGGGVPGELEIYRFVKS